MNNYITEQDNYILDMYLNEELSNEDILDLYEYGYISEDVLEYIEENKLTRGIREVGHQIVKRFIQPKLSRNYKRDAYAHELKHVRRQLNDARKSNDSKAIDYYKNRANEIKTKGNNTGFAYSISQAKNRENYEKGLTPFHQINGNKYSNPTKLRFTGRNGKHSDETLARKQANTIIKHSIATMSRLKKPHLNDNFGNDLSKSHISALNKNYKIHTHRMNSRDNLGRERLALTLYDKHTRRGNVIKLLNAISKDKH